MKRIKLVALLSAMLFSIGAMAQKNLNDVYVDKEGVMRWGKTKEEVRAFGINYTAMFAHAYRTAKSQNINLEKAIDDDIYHFARLGFDAFRVHVWDTEISDSIGNLLQNDHLKLFDYTLKKMKDRGMKFVITPIAYWGNGWPERDEKTPGFSHKYGKDNCLTNPEAIKAQQTYLHQFLDHVNFYTGVAYKNDPDIIAFEISNEPHHKEAPEKVTAFINGMVKSMRSTGCKKPIFYNISHSIHLEDAYFNADIQGGTFQWYPTNLGAGHELKGNFLRNVERYTIPFASDPKFKKAAKLVYEFDAADVGRSYIYPAMARSFRTAGMQIATHFAYDPTFMAQTNTEYGTHFMNLVYAPQKALSLMIASEVFHRIPMYKDFGQYPINTTFGEFSVSYEKDLAEMISPKTYLYTNHTSSKISEAEKLEKIAGFGNSTVVQYEGQGAYFLDKLESGVWRLEVMPDAIWTHDPFEKASPKKIVAVTAWKTWPISIDLTDLGVDFSVQALNDGNEYKTAAKGKSFEISPGTFLLTKKGTESKIKGSDTFKNIIVKEFAAPRPSLNETVVKHIPVAELTAGNEINVQAFIYSQDTIQSAEVYASAPGSWMEKLIMEKVSGYQYQTIIPARFSKEGFVRYHVVVKNGNQYYTYPSANQTHPWDWDFYDKETYNVAVVPKKSNVVLFDATKDSENLMRPWIRNSTAMPLPGGRAELLIAIENLLITDPENKNAKGFYDYSLQMYVADKISGRSEDALSSKKLVFLGRSLSEKDCKIQLAFITKSGDAYGSEVAIHPETGMCEVDIANLKKVKVVSLPRPYPGFLPYFVEDNSAETFRLKDIESLQISIGPGMNENELKEVKGIVVESVWLKN